MKQFENALLVNYNMPFQDGDLSNICGVYCLVNAYQYLYKEPSVSCENVFNEIIKYLSKKRVLAGAVTGGITFKQIKSMINDVDLGLTYTIPWIAYPNPSTKEFWNSMKDYLSQEEGCILLGMSGRIEHWTIGISSTNRAMKLIDSGTWKFLKYNMCTTEYTDPNKYILYPAQTLFIKRK